MGGLGRGVGWAWWVGGAGERQSVISNKPGDLESGQVTHTRYTQTHTHTHTYTHTHTHTLTHPRPYAGVTFQLWHSC